MIEITPIPAFSDNYLWLFRQQDSAEACIVDPGDAMPVLKYLDDNNLQLSAIVLTHHHPDHIGGVPELLQRFDVPVYGPESAAIPYVTRELHEGDHVRLLGIDFRILEIPGHTLDHIAYYAEPETQEPLLFCGDTLFAAGCGRIFEGTPEMMYASLAKLAALKPETQVFCAHEYTLSNLAFAQAVTPDDPVVAERLSQEQEKRDQGQPTLPSNLARELQSNPFLRCANDDFKPQLQESPGSALATFAALREWKDRF